MNAPKPTLALVHTTALTVPAMRELAARVAPDVRVVNLLDDSLLADVIGAGAVTDAVNDRLEAYVQQARNIGADAVMTCCSSVGATFDRLNAGDLPVLRVDRPMAERAVHSGARIGVIATVGTTLEPTAALIRDTARAAGKDITLETVLVDGAFSALQGGRAEEHDRLVTSALQGLLERVDVVVLAQASMARLVATLNPAPSIPVLSSPESGLDAAANVARERFTAKQLEVAR
jgi:Asp/Glu/hydantoin racemase